MMRALAGSCGPSQKLHFVDHHVKAVLRLTLRMDMPDAEH